MPSITYWNRLEPSPRSNSIGRSLAAEIADPLWMLTRQWQFGEFNAANSGSPAFVEILSRTSPFTSWSAGTAEGRFTGSVPLEKLVQGEPLDGSKLVMRVELGQTFELMLEMSGGSDGAQRAFRAAFPIVLDPAEQDPEVVAFASVCAGRAVDGYALLAAHLREPRTLPASVSLEVTDRGPALSALGRFAQSVERTFGSVVPADPAGWVPERLETRASVQSEGGERLSITPGPQGELAWYAFDEHTAPPRVRPAGRPDRTTVMPAAVRFSGMPNARFWDFEDGRVDFGGIETSQRDLGRLALIEFMLAYGSDWFVIPFEQPVGSACRIERLIVHDVFGVATTIARADAGPAEPEGRWTMFSTSGGGTSEIADYFLASPSVEAVRQTGPVLEDVRFLRDETANMVWAVEHTTENGLGDPRDSFTRATLENPAVAVRPPAQRAPGEPPAPLRYRIQNSVPTNWFPFVAVRAPSGRVDLEKGVLLDAATGTVASLPGARVLRLADGRGGPVTLHEEEVPRSGVRVTRRVTRTRWIDGSTHVWIERVKEIGTGEGASGLRFDLALDER